MMNEEQNSNNANTLLGEVAYEKCLLVARKEQRRMDKTWDYATHRDELWVSGAAVVYHKEYGVLCQTEDHYGIILHHPIVFKSIPKAWEWVREGYIGELQEGLCNLGVGFSTTLMKVR